jgi:hypothetical protein
MEEYRLPERENSMRAGRYARICVCLQRSTTEAKPKASLHNKVGIVTAGSRQFGARFAELYGMMKPAVHIMVGSKEMHDMEKALIDAVEHVKNAIQGRFTDALKRTRYEHKRVHGKRQQYNDYCSSKDDKASLPLDIQPLELPKPNTTNNHEQQIYRLRSRVVGNRQANENAWLL